MSAIVAEKVVKRFRGGPGGIHALRGVSLAVEPGEIFGLLGPNGAGKTTLVKVLLDVVRPTSGSASLLGVPCRRASARRPVGYLPEDHRFPEYHTPESALACYAGLSGFGGRAMRERTKQLLGMVGLAGAAKRKIRGFSKGMRQRVGLAQALIAEPRILLLDEPTDGVDPVGRAEIREILEEQKRRGTTIFLNSHLLSEVERLCDRVAILNRGELARLGTIEELTRAELLFGISTAAPVPAAVVAELGARVLEARAVEGGIEVKLAEAGAIDGVVDLLRARGVSIRGLAGKRHSLEEVFLASLKQEAAPAPGAPAPAGDPRP
jgi:ABC-2 type transport system ATP-binding protein